MILGCFSSIFGTGKSPMKITDEILLDGCDERKSNDIKFENVRQTTPKKMEINMEPELKTKLVSIEFEDELDVVSETQMPSTSSHVPTLGDNPIFPGISSQKFKRNSMENHDGPKNSVIAPNLSCFVDGLMSNRYSFPSTLPKVEEKPKMYEVQNNNTVTKTEYRVEFRPQNQITASEPPKIHTKESIFEGFGIPQSENTKDKPTRWFPRNAKSDTRPRQPFGSLFYSFAGSTSASERPERSAAATSNSKKIIAELDEEPSPKKRKSARLHEEPVPEVPEDYAEICKKHSYRYRRSDNEKLGVLKISGRDLSFLNGRQFLNDTIIDQYFNLMCERSEKDSNYKKCAALSVYFYQSLEKGNNYLAFFPKNLFQYELLFIPMNEDNHWYLYIADFVNLSLYGYDSIGDVDLKGETRRKIINSLKEYAILQNHEVKFDSWNDSPPSEVQKGPSQLNGHDCGVYVLQYADRLARNVPTMMTDNQMSNYRKRMIYELLEGRLLPPSPI